MCAESSVPRPVCRPRGIQQRAQLDRGSRLLSLQLTANRSLVTRVWAWRSRRRRRPACTRTRRRLWDGALPMRRCWTWPHQLIQHCASLCLTASFHPQVHHVHRCHAARPIHWLTPVVDLGQVVTPFCRPYDSSGPSTRSSPSVPPRWLTLAHH